MSAPLFLVRGSPTAEELAAVLAVLTARSGAAAPGTAAPPVRSRWATPVLRGPVVAAPGGWRASALPR